MIRLARKVLALDWDDQTLRLVVARTGGGQMVLVDAHSHRVPEDVDVESPESMGQFIRQMLRQHRWHHKRVIVDIPRERAVINRLTLPPTPTHELAAAVRFQAMRELPFPLDEAVVDYVVMRRDEQGLATEVLLAAVTEETLAATRATCEAAGLVPARIGLRPYANLISVQHLAGLAEQRVLFVDVGPTMAEIDVMADGQLAFARSANVSVPRPADAAREDTGSETLAEPVDLDVSDDAVGLAVNELVMEISRTLQAYRASESEAAVDWIVIAGGTGVEAEVAETVGQRLGLDTVLFDPTEALGVSPDEAVKLRSFSAALGMAWGLSREGLLELDFLNPKRPVPAGEKWRRRVRTGAIAAGVVLAAAIATDATLYLRKCDEYAAREAVVDELKAELKRYLEIENKVEEVEDWQYAAVWPDHLLWLTENAVEPGKDMLVQQIAFNGRTASITVKKMLAKHLDVAHEYASKLDGLVAEEQGPYRAELGGWGKQRQRDAQFEWVGDVRVELLELKKHIEERDDRVKQRRNKLKLRGL